MHFQRFIRVLVFAGAACAPECRGQTAPTEPAATPQTLLAINDSSGSRSVVDAPSLRLKNLERGGFSASRFPKKQFLALSVGVYAAGLADMHETMRVRDCAWWYEKDPLARPLVRLPAPAYYAAGLTLATGVNWISWRMGHSRKWHKLAFLPQLVSIVGNSYGFRSNRFANY